MRRVDELYAGFLGMLGLAVAVQTPPGDQCRMTDHDCADVALHANAATGDEQPVEHHGRPRVAVALVRSGDAQRVGPVAVPVQQPDHRALALRGAQRDAVTGVELDLDLFLIGATVGQFDHHVARRGRCAVFVGLPLLDGGMMVGNCALGPTVYCATRGVTGRWYSPPPRSSENP